MKCRNIEAEVIQLVKLFTCKHEKNHLYNKPYAYGGAICSSLSKYEIIFTHLSNEYKSPCTVNIHNNFQMTYLKKYLLEMLRVD